jgi:hypothetical protein
MKKQASAAQAQPKNGHKVHSLLHDQRFLLVVSLLLAVVVWVLVAVINGEEQEFVITGVPVQFSLKGTMAEQLGLEPFWSAPSNDPYQLTADVTVRCKLYENVTADDLAASLAVSDVNRAENFSLAIRVAPATAGDRERFSIVSISRTEVWLLFDHRKTGEFQLVPSVIGEVRVPEGYYAGEPMLSQNTVTVSGPETKFFGVKEVKALISPEGELQETTVYENLTILPVNESGDSPFSYLSVEPAGTTPVTATIHVWKRAALRPQADFLNVPQAYLATPLRCAVTPATVRAALPEDRIPDDRRYSVGEIPFGKLSPGHTKFTFAASSLKEIKFLDDVTEFTAEVDLAGYETRQFTLLGGQIQKAKGGAGQFSAAFRDVARVTVVGRPDDLDALTDEDLTGTVEIPEDAQPGSGRFDVAIYVAAPACWVYGSYKTTGLLAAP